MSLCYDFSKWTMISLASVAVSLTVSLVLMQFAHAYTDPTPYIDDPELHDKINQYNSFEKFVNYCYEHADRPNPIQDLLNQGLLPQEFQGVDCKQIVAGFTEIGQEVETGISEYNINKMVKTKERERMNLEFMECSQNQTTTAEECFLRIYNEENKTK